MKLCLITGASSGLGLEYSRQLAAKNNDMLLVSNQQEQLIQVASDLAEEYGVNAIPHYADLSTPDAAKQLFDFCRENDYEVETLVCNAGMFFFNELSPDFYGKAETMLNLHIHTNTWLCMLFGEQMKKKGSGKILIMSSLAAVLPMPGITLYSATKAYLKNFGKSLHVEMRPYGVKVTTVCPAAIATPLYGLKDSLMNFAVGIGVIWKPERLVRRALRALDRGRKCIEPGFMNIYLPVLVHSLPTRLVTRIWKKYGNRQ